MGQKCRVRGVPSFPARCLPSDATGVEALVVQFYAPIYVQVRVDVVVVVEVVSYNLLVNARYSY